jgi:hypothetical protein
MEAKGGTWAAKQRQETCQALASKGWAPYAPMGMVPFLLILQINSCAVEQFVIFLPNLLVG